MVMNNFISEETEQAARDSLRQTCQQMANSAYYHVSVGVYEWRWITRILHLQKLLMKCPWLFRRLWLRIGIILESMTIAEYNLWQVDNEGITVEEYVRRLTGG